MARLGREAWVKLKGLARGDPLSGDQLPRSIGLLNPARWRPGVARARRHPLPLDPHPLAVLQRPVPGLPDVPRSRRWRVHHARRGRSGRADDDRGGRGRAAQARNEVGASIAATKRQEHQQDDPARGATAFAAELGVQPLARGFRRMGSTCLARCRDGHCSSLAEKRRTHFRSRVPERCKPAAELPRASAWMSATTAHHGQCHPMLPTQSGRTTR